MSTTTRPALAPSVAALAALLAALPVAVGLAPMAHAADDVGLSIDGRTWSATLTEPLFDPDLRWVPGDVRVASFWVRNLSPDTAVLDITARGGSIDSLQRSGDLRLALRVGQGLWHAWTTAGAQGLVSKQPAPPGSSTRVGVRVALDPTATNQSQTTAVDLRFEVRLTQALSETTVSEPVRGAGGPRGTETGGNAQLALPGTGGMPLWLVLAGLGSLTAGIVLARRGQDKEARHE